MRAVLTYHSIDDSGSPISVGREAFARHVAWLASGRVRVVSLGDLVQSPASDAVAITFDDGFLNLAQYAAPLLEAHGLAYTVFIVSQHVGRDNRWEGRESAGIPTLPLMDWDDIARLSAKGGTIGAHTRRHRRLPMLSATERSDELEGCREDIRQAVGLVPTSLCYPYGDVDAAVAREAGAHYDVCCTTELRWLKAHEDRALVPRLDMYYFRTDGALESWGSPAFAGRVWLRAAGRRVRGFAGKLGVAA